MEQHSLTHMQANDIHKLSATQFLKHTNDKHALFQPLVWFLTWHHLWFYICTLCVFYLYYGYLSVTQSGHDTHWNMKSYVLVLSAPCWCRNDKSWAISYIALSVLYNLVYFSIQCRCLNAIKRTLTLGSFIPSFLPLLSVTSRFVG